MAVRIEVPDGVIESARAQWEAASIDLDLAWRSLHKVSAIGLSAEAGAGLVAFREAWVDRLKAAHRRAESHHDALDLTDDDFTVTDMGQAHLLRGLLPWAYHAAALRVVA